MAAPATTARVTPTGIMIPDGYQTLIALENDANINLWELEVTPPGIEGGDLIDTTTLHNVAYRTKRARQLKEVTDGSITCGYDPEVLTAILAQVSNEQSFTITFYDGSTWDFFGCIKSFTPQGASEGSLPEANVVFAVTNWDPANRLEVGPVVTEVAGS